MKQPLITQLELLSQQLEQIGYHVAQQRETTNGYISEWRKGTYTLEITLRKGK